MSGVAGAYFKVMTNTMIITLGLFLFCDMDLFACCLFVVYQAIKRNEKKNVKPVEVKKQRWVSFFISRPYISFIIVATVGDCHLVYSSAAGNWFFARDG